MAQQVIRENESGHGFDDGDGAREDAGVVTALAGKFGVVTG